MGQTIQSKMTKEEQEELSIGLLRDWWLTATQALVDSVGSERALASMTPYFVHAGKAGGIVFQKLMGFPQNDPFASSIGMGFTFATMMRTKWGPTWRDKNDSQIGSFHGCETKGQCREACISCCALSVPASHQETSPDFEMRLDKSLAFGDPHCGWLINRRGSVPNVSCTERFLIPEDKLRSYAPSEDIQVYLCHAWLGEFWVLVVRAFIDSVGSEMALERLQFYMRHSGMSIGIRLSERLNAHERKMDSIVEIVQLIQNLHQHIVLLSGEIKNDEGTVKECPFSTSPPEICLQYQAFFNGICEAIDPTFEFAYDRMMSKGEKTCHWTIRKKGESIKEKQKEEGPSDDPVKTLTMRYAKGEITEDELEKKIAHLRKLGLVN